MASHLSRSSSGEIASAHLLLRDSHRCELLKRWYQIRDMFLGYNHRKKDVEAALALASSCEHEDAVWLSKMFAGKTVRNDDDVFAVFSEHPNDMRALCFASLMKGRPWNMQGLRRSAESGYAFAQCRLGWEESGSEKFLWANRAASQGERGGFVCLGFYYRYDDENLEKAKESLRIAAELNHVTSMVDLALLLPSSDPERFVWLGRAAKSGEDGPFLELFPARVSRFLRKRGGPYIRSVIFVIGHALSKSFDLENRKIFSVDNCDFDQYVPAASEAIRFFRAQSAAARRAADAWSIIGSRLHIIKDVRILIAKMVWEARIEAQYF